MIQRELQILQASFMFFTKIPFWSMSEYSEDAFQKASRYFPIIGWIVGASGALVFFGGSLLLPRPLAVLLSMTATILITGALHEDGLADFCDGIGGGWTKEQILTIMKDSYIGIFGAIALMLSLGFKLLCLLALPVAVIPVALISAHSLSRFSSISLLYTHEYARQDDRSSKAHAVVERMNGKTLVFTALTGLLPFVLFSVATGSWLMLGTCFFMVLGIRLSFGYYLSYKIQGYTGDCLGAVQQVSEIGFYLALVMIFGA
jgi:adenosylcobinamide-GDP ribazoletransferase